MDTKINLCDTCQGVKNFPECDGLKDSDELDFPDGIGKDNILKCESYVKNPNMVQIDTNKG